MKNLQKTAFGFAFGLVISGVATFGAQAAPVCGFNLLGTGKLPACKSATSPVTTGSAATEQVFTDLPNRYGDSQDDTNYDANVVQSTFDPDNSQGDERLVQVFTDPANPYGDSQDDENFDANEPRPTFDADNSQSDDNLVQVDTDPTGVVEPMQEPAPGNPHVEPMQEPAPGNPHVEPMLPPASVD